jgi:bifunctional non-homologous end joining protein LigD
VSYVKTSGGKGLHLVVPLSPRFDWDTVKDFSEAVVEHLARTIPDRFVTKSGSRNRVRRIHIEVGRNARGATTVAAYSARARAGLGVSMPVTWDELTSLKRADQWNIVTALQRLQAS